MAVDHKTDSRDVMARLTIEDMVKGDFFLIEEIITEKMVDDFAKLSGDYSSLHMTEEFAMDRGYDGRVVHGVLLVSILSRLVGMNFPGENAILLSMDMRFISPAYIGDKIDISAEVVQISASTGTIVLKVIISNATTKKVLTRGKILIGFTNILRPE